jgi:hypothetical protein
MRTRALWLQSGLAAAIGVGIVVQIYLIAAYIFGAGSVHVMSLREAQHQVVR